VIIGRAPGSAERCALRDQDLCVIHGPKVEVRGGDSSVFYLPRSPDAGRAPTSKIVTPEESGLASRQVRCENCRFASADATICGLYKILNELLPDIFKLDVEIEPQGCCNAQMP
jgi:hypothetical protein